MMKTWEKMGKFVERKSKPAIAMMVAVTMLLSLMPTMVFAQPATSHTHPVCGVSSCNDNSHTVNESWMAWDGETAFLGGNVYLSKDVILSVPVRIEDTVNLCLNGHTISAAGGYFDITGTGTLNLCSCEENGTIKRTTTTNALVSADIGAKANLYNVTLDGGAVWGGTTDTTLLRGTDNSGNVSNSPLIDAGYQRTVGGHITLNSGVVLQNNACGDSGDGGAVTIGEDGTLVIDGAMIRNNAKTVGNAGAIKAYAGAQITLRSGDIYGNSAYKHGGALQIFGGDSTDYAEAMFTMNGGTIRNNKATGVGGGIAVSDYSQFIMNGGSIIDNTTTDSQKRGGGVGFADNNTAMSVSGNAVISGNTANNLYIGTYSCNKLSVGTMGSSANIGVTMENSSGGIFTDGGAAYVDKFASDNTAFIVSADADNLSLIKPHTHSYTYTANDNVITESCACGHEETATITVPTDTIIYDGLEKKCAAVSYSGGWLGGDLKITYINNINAGQATASITKNSATANVNFTIAKTDQTAPNVSGVAETIKGKNDGHISGLTTEMEYAIEPNALDGAYTKITDPNMNFEPGTYYVRYAAKDSYYSSPDTVVTVVEGRMLTVTLPQTQVGYTLSVNKTEFAYNDSLYFTFTLHDGYTMTDDFIAKFNDAVLPVHNGDVVVDACIEDIVVTVEGVADNTPPAAEIKIANNSWISFWNNLTFGLFFKETQDVTITVYDAGSGVESVQFYLSDRGLELDEVRSITGWSDYNGTFRINPDNKYVVYAKITDYAGNVEYINSEGMVLDATAPVIYGIEDGGVYHGDKVFKAMDENFFKIEVDGVDITDTTEGDDEFKIVADNAEHTVTVTDKAGNVTEYKITVYKKYMVTYTNGEGGSYEKEFKYGEVITIPTNEFFKDTFRKTGYTVKEWQGYTEGMTMPLKDLTFTAVYAPCEYTVTFDQNGGEAIDPITVTFGEKYGNLPSSAITGLSGGNKNWYLVDADGNVTETNIKNMTLVSTARDHKLFIKRSVLAPSVSVALTVPGGISDSYQYYIPGASQRILTANVGNMNTDVLDYTYQWYKDGTAIVGATSNVLTLDGNVSDSGTYEVEVTATLKGGTNIVVTSDTATASKEQKVKILHATNTLSYDANGGEGGPQSSYTGGTALNVSKDLPTRLHYDFIGWNTAPDGTGDSYKAEDVYTFVNDNGNGGCEVTLYAQWKIVEYTVTYMADDKPVATEKVEHGKDATLTAVPAKDGYVGKWDSDGKNITGDTTITAVYTAIPVIKPNEVKPEDKTGLEDVKAKLEEELKDDSYTDDDKKDIQDAIDDIDDALEVIGNVEAVEKLIDKLPGTIKKDDEPAIKAADDAYNALTDYEKSLVDEDAKKALDDAKAVLAELNKPAEKDSPKTGNNSSLWLWFALLFASGTGIFGLSLHEYKRRRLIKNN